jgi:PAT family beta-lactamase induction signal transducer AmpG
MAESFAAAAAAGAPRYWSDPLGSRRSRLLTFFLLYLSEGIPLGFTAGVIATYMRREGLAPEAIGAFVGSLYLPWAFKWVLGPVIDTVTSVRFGRRRTWIVGAQVLMMIALLAAAPIDFTTSLALFTAVIFAHSLCAAAQDVAIDALAVEVLPEDERGTASGFMSAGQAAGQALGGSGVLLVTGTVGLGGAYLLVAALLAAILVGVSWRLREDGPGGQVPGLAVSAWQRLATFARTAWQTLTGSRAARVGVLFAALPLGAYALSLALQSSLAVDLGLDDAAIGRLGLASSLVSAVGCVLGGWLSDRLGRRRTLAVFIALTAVPTLGLAAALQAAGHVLPSDPATLAGATPDAGLVATFWAAMLAFTFFQGLTYGSSAALYMDITNPAIAATQFTAYMALGNLVAWYTSSWQGLALSAWGYPATLCLDAALGVVAVGLLPWLGGTAVRVARGAPGP